MNDIIRKVILAKCPDYDFDRYRFRYGDFVQTEDGAKLMVVESCLTYVKAFVLKRSLTIRVLGESKIFYENLPYYNKGNFKSVKYTINKSLLWKSGDVVQDNDFILLLCEDLGNQSFYAYVLETPYDYYKESKIYVVNPYRDYVIS